VERMRANVDNFSCGRAGEGYSQSAPTLHTGLLIPVGSSLKFRS
jgi:hypothetical protein